jgi:hypothetical protein
MPTGICPVGGGRDLLPSHSVRIIEATGMTASAASAIWKLPVLFRIQPIM